MQIEVKGKNLQVTDEMREYVARRFDKIGKQDAAKSGAVAQAKPRPIPRPAATGVPVAAAPPPPRNVSPPEPNSTSTTTFQSLRKVGQTPLIVAALKGRTTRH